MSGSESPKVQEIVEKLDGFSIALEATADLKSSPSASSAKSNAGTPSPVRPVSNSPLTPKSASSKAAVAGSPPSDGKKQEASADGKEPEVKAGGTPKSDDGVFAESQNKDDDAKKSGDEKDDSEQSKNRQRSRTGSYRNTRFAGLTTPPFRDNYFKHGEKSETDVNPEVSADPTKIKALVDTQHDRPGFFVGRTRRQSEKSTDGGSKNDGAEGDENKRNSRPPNRRNRRPPPPEQYIDYQPRGYRGGQGFYRQTSYQPQPTYYQDYNYYQGPPFQQRGNRGVQRGFSYPGPPNYGGQFQQQQPQYPPRQNRKPRNQGQNEQRNSSSSFYDSFGGDQAQQQGRNKNKRRRSRTSSKRDRTASTASSTKQSSPPTTTATNSDARQVAIDVK